ncbi:DUF500-domain-containing protein [Backusella circina FSU 941]|nr:DUF500-domain-containing protein [Backusella circina FSU 941]
MPININSPLPSSLASECRKAAKILKGFADDTDGIDAIIPDTILSNAKGLAIFTVLKGGFIVSARAGSGLVIARLPDGSWSAPSAIVTGGVGFGGQVGAELTDFVMVLNTSAAVKTFISHGSITLGGNVSVAIGPIGRNAEASGTASVKSIAAVYSYSKTKGLFAGLSFEGSVILERFDANTKLYGRRVKTRELLNGTIPPPPAAESLYRVLELKVQNRSTAGGSSNSTYNSSTFNSSTYHNPPQNDPLRRNSSQFTNTPISFSRGSIHTMAKTGLIEGHGGGQSRTSSQWRDNNTTQKPIQISNTPYYASSSTNNSNSSELIHYNSNSDNNKKARALFNFRGEQQGDLPFQKGDLITIIKKSDSQNDWWTGSLNGKEGIFPANFVDVI